MNAWQVDANQLIKTNAAFCVNTDFFNSVQRACKRPARDIRRRPIRAGNESSGREEECFALGLNCFVLAAAEPFLCITVFRRFPLKL